MRKKKPIEPIADFVLPEDETIDEYFQDET